MSLKYIQYLRGGACAAALLGGGPVLAAEAKAPPAAPPATVSELVVTAEKRVEPGEVVGDIKPDLQLQPQDVAAYGVSSITELLDELAPEIGSNSGRGGEGPAILLNGRRISGFNEIRNLPTEAILRVDILPEEAALKYGFSANQRVVNIVLRDHYGSQLANLSASTTTAGGAASGQAEAGVTRISGEHRFNLDLKYNPQAALTEAQRNVTPLTVGPTLDLAGVPTDERAFRTLVSESQKVSLNAVYTRPIFAGVSATVNGTLEATRSEAQRGLFTVGLFAPSAAGPEAIDRFAPDFGALNQDASTWTGHLGVSFNRDIKTWRLALTGNYDHADSRNENDTGLDTAALQAAVFAGTVVVTTTGPIPATLLARRAQDSSQSKSDTGNVQFIASGPIWTIPAGQIRTSFRVGATGAAFSSQSERFGFSQSADFSRSTLNAQASFDVPLTSKKNKVLPFLGDLGVNAHAAIDQQSDFGSLITVGYGLHWTPVTGLSLIVSHLTDQIAPTQQQIGAAILLTPGARIFDYATGQTVDVTSVSGGNPSLTDDRRDRTSIRATYKPWADKELTFRADFNKIHIKNPITTFPAASAAIEAAFPERFLRDAEGDLTQVDFRPVNFASQDTTSLRWGFDYSRPIGPATAPPPRNAVLTQLRRAGAGSALAGSRRPGGAPDRAPSSAQPPEAGAPSPDSAPSPDATPAGPPPGGGFGGGGFAGRGLGGGGPGGGGPGGGRGGGRGDQDGRLRISVFHTVFFENNFLVRPGGPLLDFLDGAALGGGGGQPRHEIQAQLNIAERGYGAELSANWKSGSSVTGGLPAALGGTGDLEFSGLIKVNARVFADLNQRKTLIERQPWLKGARISLSVANLFDQRIEVRDAAGATPLNFQPAYVDPLGRTIRVEFRKLFS